MNTARFVVAEHQRRRSQIMEFRAFCSAAAVVFTGLLMAALYCLLTNRIPVWRLRRHPRGIRAIVEAAGCGLIPSAAGR